MKKLLNSKGFSLVELMVVVAIIGILAAIAVPNVNKFMMKARQSEAKTNLAAIYSNNKALFVEYNSFTTRFPIMGYNPEGSLRYNVGFQTDFATVPSGYTGATGAATDIKASAVCNGSNCTCLAECTTAANLPASTATASTFTAAAQSDLKKSGADMDAWSINELKSISNSNDGIN